MENLQPKSNNLFSLKNELIVLFETILHNKKLFIGVVLLFSLFGVIFSLLLPNIYLSKATLSPSAENNDLSQTIARNYSGLTSLAGISLPSVETNLSDEAVEIIRTLSFFSKLVDSNDSLIPNLIAAKKWDPMERKIKYDENIYLSDKDLWIREVDFPKQKIPTYQEAFAIFKENFVVIKDKQTGFIRISFKHLSPDFSKQILDEIIFSINQQIKDREKEKAKRTLEYLNAEMQKTNLAEIKEVLSGLAQAEIQTISLAEATEDFVFKVLDEPHIPEEKSEPNRSLIVVLFSLLGVIFSSLIIIARSAKK